MTRFDWAIQVLEDASRMGIIESAVIHVSQSGQTFAKAFGKAGDVQAMFLLGSISKPIAVTALMTLFDEMKLTLDDPVTRYLPEFRGEGREAVVVRDLLTHTSGLPDQLPNNNDLRRSHASLDEFARVAATTPLLFAPRTRYGYSSMGISLASRIATLVSGHDIQNLVEERVFKPLDMTRSAQGLGSFSMEAMIPVQTENAAPNPEAAHPMPRIGIGTANIWRKLGAPWGGTHASAGDLSKLLHEFINPRGRILKDSTIQTMITNQNPPSFTPRGLGWNVGVDAAGGRNVPLVRLVTPVLQGPSLG